MSYYQESGKVNVGLTSIWFIVGAALIGCIAYGYAFITELNPFIYLNFIATLVYVVLVGVVIGLVRNLGRIRNFVVFVFVSVILALWGLIVVWICYISILFDMALIFAVEHFWVSIEVLSDQSYSIGRALRSSSIELSGTVLISLWIIEALILVVGPVAMLVVNGKSDSVYCESCDKWAEEEKVFLKRSETELTKESVEEIVRNGRLNELFDLPNTTGKSGMYYEVKITSCESCKSRYYLSVEEIKILINKKGEEEKEEKRIFPFYELDNHQIPASVLNPES